MMEGSRGGWHYINQLVFMTTKGHHVVVWMVMGGCGCGCQIGVTREEVHNGFRWD